MGDEKRLLTDEQIESSYFFSFYDSEDYPKPEDYFYKKYQQSQDIETIPIQREGVQELMVNIMEYQILLIMYITRSI